MQAFYRIPLPMLIHTDSSRGNAKMKQEFKRNNVGTKGGDDKRNVLDGPFT